MAIEIRKYKYKCRFNYQLQMGNGKWNKWKCKWK